MTSKKTASLIVVLIAVMFSARGCDYLYGPKLVETQRVLLRTQESLQASIDEQNALLDAMTADDPQRPETQKAVDLSQIFLDRVDEIVEAFSASIDASGGIDPSAAATGLTALLPPPFNVFAGMGIGLLGGLFRSRQVASAARGVISGLESARRMSPQLDAAMASHEVKTLLRATQTPLGSRLVAEGRRVVRPPPPRQAAA